MKIWLIAGSSSGVGKTTLSNNLVSVLPNADLMKIGHGCRKQTGPPNYFTKAEEGFEFLRRNEGILDHCIVESNKLVGKAKADIIIFLNRQEGDHRGDTDGIISKTNIIIGYRGNPNSWGKHIARLGLKPDLAELVQKIFEEHHEFLSGGRIRAQTKIWFGRDGMVVFGEGLARLLSGIEKHGSLSKAAKEENISYRHAWGDIKKAEERLGFPLLDRNVGGNSGGGSTLTMQARQLLEGYIIMKHKAIKETDKWFKKLFEDILRNI